VTDVRGQLAVRVRQLRQARHLTQEELAERSDLSSKFIGEIERGRGNPALQTLSRIADGLGVGLIDLISDERDRTSRLTSRQVTQVREALASIETLVELAAPSPEPPKRLRKR
jgi:transcriptional regulator with XRE-family HTH domain